jgi:hypothetical protein
MVLNHDEQSESPSELIPPSEKFVAAVDVGMVISACLIAFVGWRRRIARRKSPDGPVPEV